MDLNLMELYLLLSIHDRKGYLNLDNFSYGFAAATLLELTLNGKIRTDNSKMMVVDHKRTGNFILDEIMDKIKGAKKQKKVSQWVFKISYKVPRYKKELLKTMERKRILRIETRKFLRLIPFKRYPITKRQLKKSVIQNLSEAVHTKYPEIEVLNIYAMVYSCGLIPVIFKSQIRKTMINRFEELMENGMVDQQLIDITKLIRKTIKIHSRGNV